MKETRTAGIFALLITALLVTDGLGIVAGKGHTSFAARVRGLLAELAPALSASAAGHATPVRATAERVTVQTPEGRTPYLNLSVEAASAPTVYGAGTGLGELAGGSRAHALASADFDEDGTPDLVGAYATAGGGVVTIQRGNVDAVFPNSPEARVRRERGRFNDAPFHAEAAAFIVPEAAHFVGAGDFDADGHYDVAAARRGGRALFLLRGDGRGNLLAPERVELPGALTAFATGEVNRPDGLADIVLGVSGGEGAAALVFESPAGALRGRPETLSLPAAASGLALGALDADSSADLAVASGNELLVVYGRDRRLSLDESLRNDVPAAEVSRSEFEFALACVAVGDFAGDERADVAVLSTGGTVQVLTRAGGDGRAAAKTGGEKSGVAQTAQGVEAAGSVEWLRNEPASVRVAEDAPAGAESLLMTAKVSSLLKHDLLVLGGGRVHVVTNEVTLAAGEVRRRKVTNFEAAPELRVSASIGTESELAAVLPMRLSASALSSLVVVGAVGKAPSVLSQAAAVTFTVNSAANTDDTNRGDGNCADANGNCTLPAATQEMSGSTNPGPFTINFNIPGAGVPVINVNHNTMYELAKPVVIDGTTQSAGRVEVVASSGHVLAVKGGNSTVRGLVVVGAPHTQAINIYGAGGNVVEGNYIGTNAGGTAVSATQTYVGIGVSTSNNRIGGAIPAARNVISGLFDIGIHVNGGSGNLIRGNYIGTNAAGTAPLGNGLGIRLNSPGTIVGGTAPGEGNLISGNGGRSNCALWVQFTYATVQGNLFGTNASGDAQIGNTGDAVYAESRGGVTTVGGTTPAARNVISGSTGRGIYIESSFNDNPAYVQGNYVGTNSDGTVALPNLGHGIVVDRDFNIVGGTAPGAGNLISGNGGDGVHIAGFFGSPNHVIQGNLVGTDVSGTLALPNKGDGIEASRADNTLIGGTTPEARNTISGNQQNGLNISRVDAPSNRPIRVEGNYIGLNRFGTGPLGNLESGVFIRGDGVIIGGTSEGAGNVVAHNLGDGVTSVANTPIVSAALISNSIHSNGALGIDAMGDGASPVSSESNVNRPELLSVTNTGAGTVVTGRIYNHGGLNPSTLQFFSNPSCDSSGYGEGQTLIGQASVAAATSFTYTDFSVALSPPAPGGTYITAVNIREPDPTNQPKVFYTSEFSNCVQLAAPTPTPTPTGTPTPSLTPTPAPLQLFVIAPARGGDAAAVTRQLTGRGFLPGATARLARAGQTDIVGTSASVTNDGTTLNATFDLAGKARGLWSVVVTNPGGATAALPDAFNVEKARAPNVWVDIIGRYSVRLGRTQKFYIAYGNTGDVDSEPTLFRIIVPEGLGVVGVPGLPDGSIPVVSRGRGATVVEFIVRNVAATSSTYLPLMLEAGLEQAHTNFRIESWALSSPGLWQAPDPEPDPSAEVTTEVVEQTEISVKKVFHFSRPGESFDVVDETTVTEADGIDGPAFERVEVGDRVEYRYRWFVPDTAAAPQGTARPASSSLRAREGKGKLYFKTVIVVKEVDNEIRWLDKVTVRVKNVKLLYIMDAGLLACLREKGVLPPHDDRVSPLMQLDALAKGMTMLRVVEIFDMKTNSSDIALNIFTVSPGFISTGLDSEAFKEGLIEAVGKRPEKLGPAGEQLYRTLKNHRDIFNELDGATSANISRWHIKEKILHEILKQCRCKEVDASPSTGRRVERAARGADSCQTCLTGSCPITEDITDLTVVFAQDPNDKIGPQGAEAARFINGEAPSSYAVFFENKPEATAPAQDVIVTDQLDLTKFDLSTFQLGPVSFGKDKFVAPPPGVSRWTTDVDLRPANNLVVRVDAGLDSQTGVVRWAFTSLDPATMRPTDDPLAGFLPPNKTAPEGEGSVLFSVSPKAGLPTGAEVRNGARIVFDVNAPIDTPVWLNTVDSSAPSSAVKQLAPTQPYVAFYVNWAGTDAGSGLRDYTVYFSEDGGPYDTWLSETTDTSGIFAGRPGKTYSFYSVARDRAGNVEAVKTLPEATTATPNVVVNVIDDARFFVLRHYRDFLGRDPDPAGFDFWTNEIAACGVDAVCVDVKRTNVSQAFFLSIEFQQTGFLAYRFHRATFAESALRPRGLPRMDELLADARAFGAGVVVGDAGWEQKLGQNKRAFAREWVERPEVLAELPAGMTATQFVDKLFTTSGVVPTAAEREAALAAFGAGGTEGRAAALRSVAESESVFNKQYNPAFVLMQYLGYLRRNPNDPPDTDYTGFDFWLAKMDEFSAPGEDVRDPLTAQRRIQRAEMVRAFLVSDEYRKRFG